MLAKKACDNGMNEAEYIRLLISQKPNDYPEIRKILRNSTTLQVGEPRTLVLMTKVMLLLHRVEMG